MNKMRCELCGSIEFIRTNDGFFKCTYCGCQYTLDQARNIVSGTVEVIHGKNELTHELSNAESLKRLGEYGEMLMVYNSLKRYYSHELIFWESFLQSYYYMILHSKSLYLVPDNAGNSIYTNLLKCYECAKKVCSSSDEKTKIENDFYSFCKQWIDNCINGQFDIIESFTYYSIMDSALIDFCQVFPGADRILELSEKNIQSMLEFNIEPDENGKWELRDFSNIIYKPRVDKEGRRWAKNLGPLFLIGKTYVYGYNCDGIVTENVDLQNVFYSQDAPLIRASLVDKWNTMDKCPICGTQLSGLIKHRTCKRCKKTYEIIKK